MSHILLTVGTKIILNFPQQNFPILSGDEVQLLFAFLNAHFLPLGEFISFRGIQLGSKIAKFIFWEFQNCFFQYLLLL